MTKSLVCVCVHIFLCVTMWTCIYLHMLRSCVYLCVCVYACYMYVEYASMFLYGICIHLLQVCE